MATTIVIIAAALVAAAVVVAVVLSRRQPSAAPQEDLVRAVDEMRSKMDALAGELSGALERAEQESRRNRLFGELGGSIDLEELMDRVLDAAMEIPGFDAAMMVVERQDGAPAVVSRGMSADESRGRRRRVSSGRCPAPSPSAIATAASTKARIPS